jgi:hypothetical protein
VPVYQTRKLRNMAAGITLLSGVTHVAQLWFVELDGPTLFAALFGIFYFLLGLGLAGQSRLSLLLGLIVPAVGSTAAWMRLSLGLGSGLAYFHIFADILVFSLCTYILIKTRHAQMD